jgi:hypothetical protein
MAWPTLAFKRVTPGQSRLPWADAWVGGYAAHRRPVRGDPGGRVIRGVAPTGLRQNTLLCPCRSRSSCGNAGQHSSGPVLARTEEVRDSIPPVKASSVAPSEPPANRESARTLAARAATEDRKSAADLEPEGGFEPPTCRLRGHRRPTTMVKAGRIAQLRRAPCQGRNDSVKGERLAETLAEQSRLSRAPRQFLPSDPRSAACSRRQRRLVHCRPQNDSG